MTNEHEKLTDQIKSLEQTVKTLQTRLSKIEQELNIEQEIRIEQTPERPSFTSKMDEDMKRVLQEKNKAKPLPPKTPIKKPQTKPKESLVKPERPKDSGPTFEQLLGIWLPRVFMIVLILGVLWGLKLSMDYGWISYGVRIVLGYLATATIFYFGYRQIQKKHTIYGITLIGGVIAIGILVTMAAFYLYNLINYPTALVISLVYIALGFYMSKKSNSEILTVFTGFAGFLLPYLLETSTVVTWTFCFYILILFLTLFYLAISGGHKFSYYITFFFFQMTLFIFMLSAAYPFGDEIYIVATALIQHLLLLFFYLRNKISNKLPTETMIYTNVVLMIAWVKLLEYNQELYAYGALAITYILLAIYGYSEKNRHLQAVFSAIAVFAVSAFILAFNTDTVEAKLSLLLINGTVGIWIGLYFKTIRTIAIASLTYLFTSLTVFLFVTLDKTFSIEHLTWLALIITMCFIFYSLYQEGVKNFQLKIKSIDISLIIGQIVLLMYLAKLIQMYMPVMNDYSHLYHINLSIFTAFILISFMAYRWRHGSYISYLAVFEFLLIGLGFLSIPTSIYTTTLAAFYFNLFVEIIYLGLFITAASMIIKGKILNKFRLQAHRQVFAVLAQVTSFVFLTQWYFAITDIYIWNDDYVYIGHTLWMFLFAFLSITLGGRFKWKAMRIIGVVLIGICLIKLFFIDLISISLVIRAVLFIIVGVIGLVYSRTLQKDT